MNIYSFINDLREAIGHAKACGQNSISIKKLDSYLDEIETIAKTSKELSEAEENIRREDAQKHFENELKIAQLQSDASLEMFKSVIEAGLNALKSAIIINGGAAVALLAFIGGIVKTTSENHVSISCIGQALLIFTIGVGLAGTATGLRYITQWLYHDAMSKMYVNKTTEMKKFLSGKIGNCLNIITVLIVVASFAAFFYGGWKSYSALTKLQNSSLITNSTSYEDRINKDENRKPIKNK